MSPSHWSMVLDILKFHKIGQNPKALTGNVEDFLQKNNFGDRFADYFLYPLGSALWSCPNEKFKRFPMEFVLHFLKNHNMLQVSNRPTWRVIKGGSASYVEKIVSSLGQRLKLNAPVDSVTRTTPGAQVVLRNGEETTCDEVILACHADQSLS